jgi:hypothetical protein
VKDQLGWAYRASLDKTRTKGLRKEEMEEFGSTRAVFVAEKDQQLVHKIFGHETVVGKSHKV